MRAKTGLGFAGLVIAALIVVAGVGAAQAASSSRGTIAAKVGAPGARPTVGPAIASPSAAVVAAAAASHPLVPYYSASGFVSLSVDAAGTNDPAGATISVQKSAGATVRKAFLFAASTGFTGYEPVDGDVTLDGSPVAWNPTDTILNNISSVNVAADVTSLVKAKIDAAPAGTVDFVVAEPNNTTLIDGEILAVVLDDPTVTQPGNVTLMYGAQSTAGDTFHVALAKPVDKTDPNFALNLSLGISFGDQEGSGNTGQYDIVDVNGQRLTSSAGGQDDGQDQNGALITAGGIGDSNDNPPDPNATDATCMGPDGPSPRCDDELYNLLPFTNNGDTSLSFDTSNPSNDDNIFFAALDVHSSAAVVLPGVVLSPTSGTSNVGQQHTLTASVGDGNGNPLQGVNVQFQVTSGPNSGLTSNVVTDTTGKALLTYTSSVTGTDDIVATFTDTEGTAHASNVVTQTWVSSNPSCQGIYLVGARGLGETNNDYGGYGHTMAIAISAFRNHLKGLGDSEPISAHYLDYNTNSLLNLIFTGNGFLKFVSGANVGINKLEQMLISNQLACPNQRIVLFGYSEGALVVDQTLVQLQNVGSTIPQHVIAVGLIADPHRLGGAPYTSGTAHANLNGLSRTFGLYGSADLPVSVRPNTVSYCTSGDMVCAWDTGLVAEGTIGIARAIANTARIHPTYWQSASQTVGDMVAVRASLSPG